MGGHIEFRTADIGDIGAQTAAQQAEWDAIWERCRTRLMATASEALDNMTGATLEDRNMEYNRKSVQYSANVAQQAVAVNQIRSIATETNAGMVAAMRPS